MTFEFDFIRDIETYHKHVGISGGVGLETVPVVVKANGDYIPEMGEMNTPPDGFNDQIDIWAFFNGTTLFLSGDDTETRINVAEYAWDQWMRLTDHEGTDNLTIEWEGSSYIEAEATVSKQAFETTVRDRCYEFYEFFCNEFLPYCEANADSPHPEEVRIDIEFIEEYLERLDIHVNLDDD